MRLDDWAAKAKKRVDEQRKEIAAHGQELANALGVSTDDPNKMALLHSLATIVVQNGVTLAELNGEQRHQGE